MSVVETLMASGVHLEESILLLKTLVFSSAVFKLSLVCQSNFYISMVEILKAILRHISKKEN
jgi:hypothetical protein